MLNGDPDAWSASRAGVPWPAMRGSDYLTAEERRAFIPPACPACGGRSVAHWTSAPALSDMGGEERWTLDTYECADLGCVER